MRYLPLTDTGVAAILKAAGVSGFEDLIRGIPPELRTGKPYNIPGPMDELALMRDIESIEIKGRHIQRSQCFLGGGCHPHFIPGVIDHLASRGEFLTAYTPYQPEVSQGTLQAAFEFQSFVCLLTGMEVANASMYDGATALAEAALMAHRLGKKKNKLVLSRAVHPEYRAVLRTLTQHQNLEIVEVPITKEGQTDLSKIHDIVDGNTFAVILQSPNALGVVEDLSTAGAMAHQPEGCFYIVAVAEALSLGVLQPPGAYGADMAVGEGQSWGIPMGFGGPHLGWFATKDEFIRQMPGRLCGLTADGRGNRAFTLTLSTREQHIRREKATSNICTNQGAMALRATIYLSLMGHAGITAIARANVTNVLRAMKALGQVPGVTIIGGTKRFNEITFALPTPAQKDRLLAAWLDAGLQGGIDLAGWYPEMDRHILSCFTELHGPEELEPWVKVVRKVHG